MNSSFADLHSLDEHAAANADFRQWRDGYGVIRHLPETQEQVVKLAKELVKAGHVVEVSDVYQQLSALDHLTCAGLWLVAHMTYANVVRTDGAALNVQDFKVSPEGHTGGALNMVPAYAAYLALNSLTEKTRSWLMGQGHCVAAIDALNVLTGNLHPEQEARYCGTSGLTQLVRDFYSYRQEANGRNATPLGSHVNAHTAGGILEGGYLGFAELQYAHMPMPGETLVAFLSDGAAEEQRGSDWVPRWWRSQDCGPALPVMIANGRRIEQRTELGTRAGLDGFIHHLKHSGFDPIRFDGRDPAAFVCTLYEMERRLARYSQEEAAGQRSYPVPIPYGIAETVKGYGFYGAGQNEAHNLPLPGNPRVDARSRELFNSATSDLWVPPELLASACSLLSQHQAQSRPRERDHPLGRRHPKAPELPELPCVESACSPMLAVDDYFQALVAANPDLRPRVGNPDELASNKLSGVLATLKHRVTEPENELESIHGCIITALNEEAVVSACLGNKAGLNLVASYEAFCVKMLGAIRQEVIFARHQKEVGRPAGWLGFPIVATSHTWENGKNEQSHQDTTFCEALLAEMNDGVRVLFPADYNSTLALLPSIYSARGLLSCLVVPKRSRPLLFDRAEAEQLARDGALVVAEDTSAGDPILLIANGAYQLSEMIRASERLHDANTPFRLVYVQEPGRFRMPRDEWESGTCLSEFEIERLCPSRMKHRVLMTHMRPEAFRGHVWRLCPEAGRSRVLGYVNRGGTFNEAGMLFANRCTWAHALLACAELLDRPASQWLSPEELAAAEGRGNPGCLAG
ncbi:xylulose 5-phosphate 3-epimerase [Marinobacter salicampi]|uniref:xylulose 5-phosphate 3-epimerase n=1 Tax=Marinobacter salicampi TaxID=435907 RepID=UPI00140CA6B2|nr:xylulose 5-phosphate 3-epimerase [Marinobacter salicampi]